jgi:hypothetical protein
MTDFKTEGYIGVTRFTAEDRFKKHVHDALTKEKRTSKIHNVIRKYGVEDLIVETLLWGSKEFCYSFEHNMRSSVGTGWNVAIGGVYPTRDRTQPCKPETKKKIGEANRKNAENWTNEQRKAHAQRVSEFQQKLKPWERNAATYELWVNAETFYKAYISGVAAKRVGKETVGVVSQSTV